VTVVPADPAWPREFERIALRVRTALGELVVAVDHVGSTAVPGLAAKPIIDLDVAVRSHDDLPATIAALEAIGYRHEGDLGVAGRAAFAWPPGEHRHHLYLVVAGNAEHRRHLLLRDYLSADPAVAHEYGALKQRLAERHRDDRAAYASAKGEHVGRLLERASAEIEDRGDGRGAL
jgi:GrpB-like predicted nucleotidyltransferase (UPF0157 family)